PLSLPATTLFRSLWLLRERLGPPGGRSSLQTEQLTGLDVAVGGCRMAGHDADGDDVAGLGGGDGLIDDEAELVDVRDRMVGGEGSDDRFEVLRGDEHGGQADRRRGVLR